MFLIWQGCGIFVREMNRLHTMLFGTRYLPDILP